MYQPLLPCPACNRHVRATDAHCPFCAAALPEGAAPRPAPEPLPRLSRAAAFVFGASLAVTACETEVVSPQATGGTSSGTGAGGGSGTGGAGQGGATPDGGPEDDGGMQALYGDPPPFDAGPDDDGGTGAKYGAPPPPIDGGDDASDDGGAMGLYGAPPPPPKQG